MMLVTLTSGELVYQEYWFVEDRVGEIMETLRYLERGWQMEKKA